MAQLNRISRNNTTIHIDRETGKRQVFLHNTCIVETDQHGRTRLYTGGWNTVTTRTRMNQTANEWALGFQVSMAGGQFSARLADGRVVVSQDGRTLYL